MRFNLQKVSPFKFDTTNPFHLLAYLAFSDMHDSTNLRKNYANEVINIFKNDYYLNISPDYDCYHLLTAINSVPKININDGFSYYEQVFYKTIDSMFVDISTESNLQKMYSSFVTDVANCIQTLSSGDSSFTYINLSDFFVMNNGLIIDTIHGVKGKEFNTVIAFGLLEGFIPHWNVIKYSKVKRKQNVYRLLYVLCSRAKENLFLFSECSRKTKKGHVYTSTKELLNIKWDYGVF